LLLRCRLGRLPTLRCWKQRFWPGSLVIHRRKRRKHGGEFLHRTRRVRVGPILLVRVPHVLRGVRRRICRERLHNFVERPRSLWACCLDIQPQESLEKGDAGFREPQITRRGASTAGLARVGAFDPGLGAKDTRLQPITLASGLKYLFKFSRSMNFANLFALQSACVTS
jgi:hypothetical protein